MTEATPTTKVNLPLWAQEIYRPASGENEDFYVIRSGRGTGKSQNIATMLVLLAMEKRLRIVGAREIMTTIKDSSYAMLVDMIVGMGVKDQFDITKNEITHKKTGSNIIFIGLRGNVEQIKSLANAHICWLDEAVSISRDSLNILIPTIRAAGSYFIFTYNQRYAHDPIEQYFIHGDTPPRTKIITLTQADNPWFPEKLRRKMEHDYKANPLEAAHIWGGEYKQTVEGSYYTKEIKLLKDSGRHIELFPEAGLPIRAYFDLGSSVTDSTAIVICQFINERINVLDFFEGNQQPPSYYMNWVRDKWGQGVWINLPFDGSHTHQDNPIMMSQEAQWRAAGWHVKVIKNAGKGAVLQRVNRSRDNFHRIYINTSFECKALLGWLALYHEKKNQMGMITGPAHDEASHPADAFGYMVVDWRPPRKKTEGPATKAPKLSYG